MALPKDKQSLADWILRRLGAPVINIEVADIQLEDCIDEAVRFYQEYHYDGAQRSYRTIQITEEMLDGNARKPRGISAPAYNVSLYDSYRIGDRVTTYDENQQPIAVWIKFDSEERVIKRTYFEDSEGQYFVFTGQEADLVMIVFDSDGGFVTYDSDLHNSFNYTLFESDISSATSILFIDSDGVFVNYDSDKHVLLQYDVLTFDSDPTSLGFVLYVDSESLNTFRSDSDIDKVIYDSDRHVTVFWDSEVWPTDSDASPSFGSYWVDSDGTKVLYDSDKHTVITFDSDIYGDWIYDINSANFVLYDSDNDSDNLYLWNGITRFTRNRIRTLVPFKKRTEYPILYTRQEKFPQRDLFTRKQVLLGTRYDRTEAEGNRRDLSFNEMWKKESAVINEPTLNLDYSKEGQIGIQVPEDIIAVTKVFRLGQQSSLDMYNYEYQLFLNNFDFFYGHGGGGGLSNYYTTKMNLEHIDFLLNTQPAIRFNKHKDRLYIDMDWNRAHKGDHLVCEVYEITDPDVWGKVYQDIWLKKYATALVKQQWGSNLRKYENVELPGGIVLSGQSLYDEAKDEIEKLEEEIKNTTLEMDSILVG